MITVYFPILYCLLVPVYMEASYPGKWAGSVAETNYFVHLYGPFHPVNFFLLLIIFCTVHLGLIQKYLSVSTTFS